MIEVIGGGLYQWDTGRYVDSGAWDITKAMLAATVI